MNIIIAIILWIISSSALFIIGYKLGKSRIVSRFDWEPKQPQRLTLLNCKRFQEAVFLQQIAYAQQLEQRKPERIAAHKEAFAALVKERRDVTEILPVANKDLAQAIQVVKRAMKTGQLGEEEL